MKITLKVEKEFDAKFLQVKAAVRYWDDTKINGENDTVNGDNIPCKKGEVWSPLIEIETGKIVDWEIGKTAEIHYKVCDEGIYTLYDEVGKDIKTLDGYVISDLAIGESGFGDYIILTIDGNGVIQNWNPKLSEFLEDED